MFKIYNHLFQISPAGPNCGVTRHIIMGREQFHASFARIDDENNVIYGDGRFSDICRQYNL